MDSHPLVTRHDLRNMRLKLGITITALARHVHTTPRDVMDMEDGLKALEEHELFERAMTLMARTATR
jgi:DNA-binding transcriptional regulator YiaG